MSSISFIQRGTDGLIYIGVDVVLDRLQATTTEPLQILVKILGGSSLEQRLHSKFNAATGRGWFEPEAPLLAYIAEAKKLNEARAAAEPMTPPSTSPLQILRDVATQAKREEWIAAIVRHKGNLTRAGKDFGISQPSASIRTRDFGLTDFLQQIRKANGTGQQGGRPLTKVKRPRGRPSKRS